jgi:hypothetical protein
MKKNSLTTALLAGLAGAAGLACSVHAANLNPDGLGQALVYPYYTVNGDAPLEVVTLGTVADLYEPGADHVLMPARPVDGFYASAWDRAADSERLAHAEPIAMSCHHFPPGKPG